ncbi:DUF3265 domain-containing protein [Vibrio parahaemolyticus]|nr:DUF3265 domain-containing protein [Vibrio parahaemolyticus]
MRNAWHFYHALIFAIKVVFGSIVLRCSPLKRALGLFRRDSGIFTETSCRFRCRLSS